MLKYRGQYRVVFEMDKRTGKPAEFCFVPCKIYRGTNVYRYSENKLGVYIPSKRIFNRLSQNEIFEIFCAGDSEGILLFEEKNLKIAEKALHSVICGRMSQISCPCVWLN